MGRYIYTNLVLVKCTGRYTNLVQVTCMGRYTNLVQVKCMGRSPWMVWQVTAVLMPSCRTELGNENGNIFGGAGGKQRVL